MARLAAAEVLTKACRCYTMPAMKGVFVIVLLVVKAGCTARPGALKVSGDYTVQAVYGETK